MRPLSLTLEGFGSYVTATHIPLSEVQLAAITGANGTGKSTIFDAIVFALFGMSRVGGRDSDAVVSLGAEMGSVAFEFELNDATWRATRTRVKGKRTTALLEVFDPESVSGWTARSDGSVRNTDKAIADLLGMSADTFLATVMVGQGDADRFTSSDPAKRKEVLGEVLGLDVFAVWGKRVKSELDAVRERLGEFRGKAEPLTAKALEHAQVADGLEQAKRKAEASAAAAERADARRFEAESRLAAMEADIKALERARERLERAEHEYRERAANLAQQAKAAAANKDRADRVLVEAEAALARSRDAAAQVPAMRRRVEELEAEAHKLAEERDAIRDAGQERKIELTRLESEVATLDAQIAERHEQAEALGKAMESGSASCWVCTQDLPPEKASSLAGGLRDLIGRLRADKDEAARKISDLNKALDEMRAEFARLREEAEQKGRAADESRQAAERAANEAALEGERAARVEEARAAVKDAEQRVSEIQSSSLNSDLADLKAEVAALEERAAGFGALRAAAQESARAAEEARKVHQAALEDRARLEERMADVQRAVEELSALDQRIKDHEVEEADWASLMKAFSKDGVPALVVASVVPELEDQANQVLDLLSNGTLRIRLATEKQTKSGTTRDTLEVAVESPDGERPYETFSGGERLRIDLALRIGLSRLLANRSGTQMRMLVIDEGWGALDTDGVSSLADCLRVLYESGEFGAVYTVTHIPEIASSFPKQVMVSRDVEGFSAVEVSAA